MRPVHKANEPRLAVVQKLVFAWGGKKNQYKQTTGKVKCQNLRAQMNSVKDTLSTAERARYLSNRCNIT